MPNLAPWTTWNGLRSLLATYLGQGFRTFLVTLATTGLAITAAVTLCGFLVAWDGALWKGWIGAGIGAVGGLVLGLAATLQYTSFSIVQATAKNLKLGERVTELLLGQVDESLAATASPEVTSAQTEPPCAPSTDIVRALREGARSLLAERPAETRPSLVRSWIARATQSAVVWATVRVLSGKARQLAGRASKLNLTQLRQAATGHVDDWIVSAVGTRLLLAGALLAAVVLGIVLILTSAVRVLL